MTRKQYRPVEQIVITRQGAIDPATYVPPVHGAKHNAVKPIRLGRRGVRGGRRIRVHFNE